MLRKTLQPLDPSLKRTPRTASISRCKVSLLLALASTSLLSQPPPDLVVAVDGSGDAQTIQAAIDMIPQKNTERFRIFIKPGRYEEQIFIDQNCVSLEGADPATTIIRYPILRRIWRETHPDDWGAASLNIKASDLILKKLTILNDHGDVHGDRDHQFAVRLMQGTRIIFDECRFISGGGDTVSLWDTEIGQYYHRDCYFEGYVDLLCPRGWCYVTNSRFNQRKKTAILWHDGSRDSTQRLVVRHAQFDGVPGFQLGRRHRDGQFILLDCSFSERMADQPIYRVTYPEEPERNAANLWGDRNFFHSCSSVHDFAWYADNLEPLGHDLKPQDITAVWTFEGRWNPEAVEPPELHSVSISGKTVRLKFAEIVTVKGTPQLSMRSETRGTYVRGSGSAELVFQCESLLSPTDVLIKVTGQDAWIFSSAARLTINNLVIHQ